MDPATEQVVSYAGGKVADALLAQFKTQVIDRWSRYRARQFFAAFAEGLGSGTKSDQELARDLSAILTDQHDSDHRTP